MDKNSKLHYAWVMCVVGVLLVFMNTGCVVNSVYNPYFIENGLSNTQSSLVVTVRTFSIVIAMAIAAPFYRKLSLKLGLGLFTLFGAVGMFFYAAAHSFTMFAAGAVCAGICHGLAGNIPVSMLTNNWFHGKKNLVYGITMAASGFTGVVLPPVFTNLAGSHGFPFASRTVGIAFAVVAVIAFLLVKDEPSMKGLKIYGHDMEETKKSVKATRFKLPDGAYHATTVHTVLVAIVAFFWGFTLYASWSHLAVLFSAANYEPTTFAWYLSVAGFALMAGKIIGGIVIDKTNADIGHAIFTIITAVGLALVALSGTIHSNGLAFSGSFLRGFGGICSTSVLASITSELYPDVKEYKSKLVVFTLVYNIGGLVTAPLFGRVADAVGSYSPVFWATAIVSVLQVIILHIAYKGSLKNGRLTQKERVA